ncbi:MAG: hypothetical protein VB140_08355 [Burkholderia sp.]
MQTSEVRNPFRCVLTLDLCNNGPYHTKPCHAAIAAQSSVPSTPPREGALLHFRYEAALFLSPARAS